MGLAQPPAFPPGEGFLYSDTNTVLLGLIIEQVTGMPVAQAFQERIFDRPGLTRSSFPALEDASIPEPQPRTSTFGTNVETIDGNVLPPEVQEAARAGTLEPMDVTDVDPSWAWTAGGGISTAGDLADYVAALVGGGLPSAELQEQRIASVRPLDPADPASPPATGWPWPGPGPSTDTPVSCPAPTRSWATTPSRTSPSSPGTSTAPAPDGRDPVTELARAVVDELYGDRPAPPRPSPEPAAAPGGPAVGFGTGLRTRRGTTSA